MSLARNSLLYLISTICLKAVGFLLLPIYTHMVSPTEYGYVYVVSAFQTFMGLFLTLSMHAAIGRFYFECKGMDKVRQMYSLQMELTAFTATVIIIFLLLFKEFVADLINLPEPYYIYAVLISYFSLFYNMVISLLYAKEQAVRISITSIIVGFVTIVVQLVLVFVLDDKALALILSMFISSIITFIIFLFYSTPYFVKPRFFKKDIVKYYKYSFSQLPSDVSVWFVAVSDRILLNRMQGTCSAGIYGVGNTLGQIPSMIYQSVNKAYVPFVFRHFKEAEDGNVSCLKNVAETTVKVESIFTCVVVILIVLSNNVVSLLESQYIDNAVIMPLILFAVWIDCNRIIFMNPLSYNVKYLKVKSFIWVLAAVLDVCLNLYLIPRYSVYGACATLIISYGVSCLLILYFSNKAIKINYDKKKLGTIIVVSALFCFGYFIGSDWQALLLKIPLIILYTSIIVYINNLQSIIIKYIKCHV